jgi:hypothetical protein
MKGEDEGKSPISISAKKNKCEKDGPFCVTRNWQVHF